MSSTLNDTTQQNSSVNHGSKDAQHEDDILSVQQVISLYQANKLDKSNAWNCELIDRLDMLVRNHNAYLRNFRVIVVSLDATMKLYSIRVDTVCCDVFRLCGYGILKNDLSNARNARSHSINARAEQHGTQEINQAKVSKKRRRRRIAINIIENVNQLNGPLSSILLPDDITFKFNSISEDTASVNRLFITSLPTKMANIQINYNEQYFDSRIYDLIEFQDDSWYDNYYRDLIALQHYLPKDSPIRPMNSALSGYRIENSPTDESRFKEPSIAEDFDVAPEFAFDYEDTDWVNSQIPTQRNTENPPSTNDSTIQDLNNNAIIPLNESTPVKENNDLEMAIKDISKGEYSYRKLSSITHFLAGPSYWKLSNRPSSSDDAAKTKIKRKYRRKKIIKKPIFIFIGDDDNDDNNNNNNDNNNNNNNDHSDGRSFTEVTSDLAKTISNRGYKNLRPEKLKLPQRCIIPKDLFYSYTFRPSAKIFETHLTQEAREMAATSQGYNYDDDDDDDNFQQPPMDFEHHNQTTEAPDEESFNLSPEGAANISEHFENAPQAVEKIPITFDKRAKVVNMTCLNNLTARSIDKQLVTTAQNGRAYTSDTGEEFEPGKALSSIIYKDLIAQKRKFMHSEFELTPGLVMFSILNVCKEGLRISRKPDHENDFQIVQLKKTRPILEE